MRDDGEVGEKSNDRVWAVLMSSVERYKSQKRAVKIEKVGLLTQDGWLAGWSRVTLSEVWQTV